MYRLIQCGTGNGKEQTGYCTRNIASVVGDTYNFRMHVEFTDVYSSSLKLNSFSNKE